jgi:hypothetical protein
MDLVKLNLMRGVLKPSNELTIIRTMVDYIVVFKTYLC